MLTEEQVKKKLKETSATLIANEEKIRALKVKYNNQRLPQGDDLVLLKRLIGESRELEKYKQNLLLQLELGKNE